MFLAIRAQAFSLTPMSIELEPSGKEATKSFLLDNTTGEKIAVQISMAKRVLDVEGKETNPEADDEFIVYPPQLILAPNEKRTVRLTWAGQTELKQELAYRIIAEQMPVDTEKKPKSKNASIRMLLRYLGAVYITPKDSKPLLSVLEAKRVENSKSGATLSLTVENRGTAHYVVKALKLTITSGNKTAVLTPEQLKPVLGQNILAGAKRRFTLAWPQSLPKGDPKVDFRLED